MGIFPLLSLAFDSRFLSLECCWEASLKLYKIFKCLFPLLVKQTNMTWSITWFWRFHWVKLYFFACSQAAPSQPVDFCHWTDLLLLSRNQELGGYMCAFPVRLLWVAEHPLNCLQLYLTKTPGLKWAISVLWISVGAHLEGSEESLGCVHFCYSCNLCRDVTPSPVMWDHFWKTLSSHVFYTNPFSVSGQSTNAMKNVIYW